MANVENKYPPGWDEKRVRKVLDHYENLTEEEVIAEDDAAFERDETVMEIPENLLPEVRQLLAKNAS